MTFSSFVKMIPKYVALDIKPSFFCAGLINCNSTQVSIYLFVVCLCVCWGSWALSLKSKVQEEGSKMPPFSSSRSFHHDIVYINISSSLKVTSIALFGIHVET